MSERTRRWLVLIAALAAIAVTVRLGVWQLSRAAQKEALQAGLAERGAMPPLPQGELARDAATATAQWHRHVRVRGRWLAQHTVYLDNRQMDGRPGFYVLTPLELAPGDAVIVQRGWAPRDARDRARVPSVPTPAGEVVLDAVIAPPPSQLYALGAESPGALRQNLDLAAFARETGLALRPLSLMQTDGQTDGQTSGQNDGQRDTPDAPSDGLARRWPAPAADVYKHYGYAFQWFALATLVAGLYVWFQLLRPRLRARRAA